MEDGYALAGHHGRGENGARRVYDFSRTLVKGGFDIIVEYESVFGEDEEGNGMTGPGAAVKRRAEAKLREKVAAALEADKVSRVKKELNIDMVGW